MPRRKKRMSGSPVCKLKNYYPKKLVFPRIVNTFLIVLLLASAFNLTTPAAVLAASETLEISGAGVTNPVTLTRAYMEGMKQHQETYSTINTWPTKKWYVGKGVKLWDLLLEAGLKKEEATMLRFTAVDGYTVTLTMQELFQDRRYRFPNFKMTSGSDADGHLPGDPTDKTEVEPIIGLISVEGSDNPEYMNDLNTLLLMLGQRTVTEQTGNLFVKYLNKIEVLVDKPGKWDAPQANPPGGNVPKGAMVTLSNLHNDDDKVHYTTDGSTPTMNSPMYNWIASRWWSSRSDVLGKINHPIGPINENTTIKAITIGPGKRDSDVVTFNFYVDGSAPDSDAGIPEDGREGEKALKVIKLTIGQLASSVNSEPYTLDAVPFVKAGRTLVPLRFISEALGAEVAWNPETSQVTVAEKGKEIVLTLGSKETLVNGQKGTVECAPELLNNRTFVPLRFISETLEATVDYAAGGGITITK